MAGRSRKIKVLHLISAERIFGAEQVMLSLAKGLKDEFEISIGVLAKSEVNNEVLREAKRLEIEAIWIPSCAPLDVDTFRYIRRIFDRKKIDLVHSHNYKSNFYAFTCHGRRIWVSTAHCWGGTDWKAKGYDAIDKLLIRFADKVIGVSLNLMEEFDQIKIPKQKQVYIPNGLDWDGLRERNLDDVFTVGFIGRFEREKNISVLVDSVVRFLSKDTDPRVKVLLVGDGSLRGLAERKIKDNGLTDSVFFTGKVDSSKIEIIYQKLDLLFLPSLKEGLPMVVLEALNWGVPILGSYVALRDVGKGEFARLISNPKDVNEMVLKLKEMKEIYFHQRERYLWMSQLARDKAREFSESKMVGSYRTLYNDLIDR